MLPWKSSLLSVESVNFLFVFLSLIVLASIWVWGSSSMFLIVLLSSSICFLLSDVLGFFIVFEVIVFPMAMYIAIGKTGERVSAVMFFILYTLCTSIPFFVGLLWNFALGKVGSFLLWGNFSTSWLTVVMIFMFMVKFPVFLVHGWLPRAHVEAPTLGSVLLASILLKLGSYGFLRLLMISFCKLTYLTFSVSLFGALVAGALCFIQSDCKAFIAMSSVCHMSGLWAAMATTRGFLFDPAILVSVSHGFVAGCLFFCIGHFYEGRASRSMLILREGWSSSTLLMLVWVLACFMNAGFPLTASLFGELAMFQAIAIEMLGIALILVASGVIGGIFSFSLFDWTSFQKDSKQGSVTAEIWLLIVCLSLSIWNLFIVFWA